MSMVGQPTMTETKPATDGPPPAPPAEKKEEPTVTTAPQQKPGEKKNPPQNQNRKPSDKAVFERAKRLAQSELQKKLAPIAKLLGMGDRFDEGKLKETLTQLQQAKEEGLSVSEKVESRLKDQDAAIARLTAELGTKKTEGNKLRRQLEKAQQQAKDMRVEFEIRQAAQAKGIVDTSYALHLFETHVSETGNGDADPNEFFEGLKKDNRLKHLFSEEKVAAAPPSLPKPAETKPAAAAVPPQGSPPPAPPSKGGPAEEEDVTNLSRREFAERTQKKYGFAPHVGV